MLLFCRERDTFGGNPFGQRPQRRRSCVENRGNLSIRISVCPYVGLLPAPSSPALSPLGPILTQILPDSSNPSNMALIQAKWLKSKQNGPIPNLARKSKFWNKIHHFGLIDLRPWWFLIPRSWSLRPKFWPFGAGALPLDLNLQLLKQGAGTADHLLPLGCYFQLPLPSVGITGTHYETVSVINVLCPKLNVPFMYSVIKW